jgi:hypothetical protein
MKLIKSLCFLILFSSYSFEIQAQTIQKNDTSILGYKGTENYYTIIKDSILYREGKYSFTSELLKIVTNDSLRLKELKIEGNYLNNRKSGNWKFNFYNYNINDLRMSRSSNITLSHNLSGIEDELSIPYKAGNFDGRAEWRQKSIAKGRAGTTIQIASANFRNDTLVGIFNFSINDVTIKGQTNTDGFLDGIIQLTYNQDNDKIFEKRKYKNGFLLELEKRNLTQNETIINLIYEEVYEGLEKIERNEQNLNFKVSEKYFGLNFNLGYNSDDVRIKEQLNGNNILNEYFYLFDSINNLQSRYPKTHQTKLKLTKRFHFIYDATDDSVASELSSKLLVLKAELNGFLNKPNLILRKNNSDNLYLQYEVLKHINSKVLIIEKVLDKITDGFFDYMYRNKYYENGIEGLNNLDTITYFFKNTQYSKPFKISYLINNSDSLLENIETYLSLLKLKTEETINNVRASIITYENQDVIDSLDRLISQGEEMITNLYPNLDQIRKEEQSKIPFSYKLLISLNERTVNQLKSKYLNNSLPQNEMIALGNDLTCYNSFLIDNKSYLDRIGNMKKFWNDSLFTRYRDNPFDNRKLETKILEGVQNSANILLTHYATLLLNAKSCEQLATEIKKIEKLNERIKYLVKNQDSENVQQLNRALRRERVPSRIERILELQ